MYGIDHALESRNEIVTVKAHQRLERRFLVPALGGNGAADDQQPRASACTSGEERDCLVAGMAVLRGLEHCHGAEDIAVLDGEAVDFPGAGKHLGDGSGLGGHFSPWELM